MKLAIVAGGGANFYSVEVAIQRLGIEYELTTDKAVIEAADGIIFPGVGFAKYAMDNLAQYDLIDTIKNYKKPFLGFCLGMQLLYEYSDEGNVECLGIFKGTIRKFDDSQLIVPQMGWNNCKLLRQSRLLDNVDLERDVYFVHSYYAPVNEFTVASSEYGDDFTAIAEDENFYATQFHPEKSGAIGEQILANFIKIVQEFKG